MFTYSWMAPSDCWCHDATFQCCFSHHVFGCPPPKHWVRRIFSLVTWSLSTLVAGLGRYVSWWGSVWDCGPLLRWRESFGCKTGDQMVQVPPRAHVRDETVIDGSLLQMEHIWQEGRICHCPLGFGGSVCRGPRTFHQLRGPAFQPEPPCSVSVQSQPCWARQTGLEKTSFFEWPFVTVSASTVLQLNISTVSCLIHVTFLVLITRRSVSPSRFTDALNLLFGPPKYDCWIFDTALTVGTTALTLWVTAWMPHLCRRPISQAQTHIQTPSAWYPPWHPCPEREHWHGHVKHHPGAQRQALRGPRHKLFTPSLRLCSELQRTQEV